MKIQYNGYQQKTLQARTPRLTSSTQKSSKVIQLGRFVMFDGLTRAQKSGCWMLRYLRNTLGTCRSFKVT